MRKLVITVENLGIDDATSHAVLEAIKKQTITSTSLVANGESYKNAVSIIKTNPNLDIGVSLNITEGKSLSNRYFSPITANDGYFDKNFFQLLLFSRDEQLLKHIEAEFRAQIEKIINSGVKPQYIASIEHVHMIPNIFNIVCKLAKEYGIENIRTHKEPFYVTPELIKHLNKNYLQNLCRHFFLNVINIFNLRTLGKYELLTNKNIIGTLYHFQMDIESILFGINALHKNTIAEILLHATTNKWRHAEYLEYKTLIHPDLLEQIANLNAQLASRSEISKSSTIEIESTDEIGTTSPEKFEYYCGNIVSSDIEEFETIVHTENLAKILNSEKINGHDVQSVL